MYFTSPDVLTSSGLHWHDKYSVVWYGVADTSMVGKTLKELDLYQRTGTTIAAVRRGDTQYPYPAPEFQLKDEDELYVIGTALQLACFEELFEPKRITVPSYE